MEDVTLQLRIAGLIAGRVPAQQELELARGLLDKYPVAVADALRGGATHSFCDSQAADVLAMLANDLSAAEGRFGAY
jgi:hypothetical protein